MDDVGSSTRVVTIVVVAVSMSVGIVVGTFDDSNTTSDPSIAGSDDDDIVVGIMVGVVLPGACEGSPPIITRAGSGAWRI